MENMDEINWDKIELNHVKFNSKKNLTELIDDDFLQDLNSEFEDVNCINIILNLSNDSNEPPKLLVLSHNNDEEVINKKVGVEFNSVNISGDEYIRKIINLLSK